MAYAMSNTSRQLFTKQPAHFVILDISSKNTELISEQAMNNFEKALRNFSALASNLQGPPRISKFGIMIVTSIPEVIFHLHPMRGQQSQLFQTIVSLQRTYHQEQARARARLWDETPENEIVEAIPNRKPLEQAVFEAAAAFSSENREEFFLEMSVFTQRSIMEAAMEVERALQESNLADLRKVLLCVMRNEPVNRVFEGAPVLASVEDTTDVTRFNRTQLTGHVEIKIMSSSLSALEIHMRSWLHEKNTDMEHAHLVFPKENGGEHIIKLDIYEKALWPNLTNCPRAFYLQPEGWQKVPGSVQAFTTDLYRFRAVKRLDLSGMCMSSIHGMPRQLLPSNCWKMTWEEMTNCQEQVTALSEQMSQMNQGLLVLLEPRRQEYPKGHFLILGDLSGTLLLMGLVDGDLWMPSGTSYANGCSENNTQLMQNLLTRLDLEEQFNPLHHRSGLCDWLYSNRF